jgi:hypothetical protein
MCYLQQFVQVCIAALWLCEEKQRTRKKPVGCEAMKFKGTLQEVLSVKEQVKQHCDEINGNSCSERKNVRSLNIMDRKCISLLFSCFVSSNFIAKRVY